MRKVLYILGKLDEQDIDWMVESGSRRKVPQGTQLITQGQPVDFVYVVLDGQLEVKAGGADTTLNTLGAGEVVGELSFLDSRPPAATVTASQDSLLLSIPRSELQVKLNRDVGFAARFYHALGVFLADRLRTTVARLGYGGAVPLETQQDEDELDEEMLDDVSIAGSRFDWLLQRLRGH